MACRWGAVCQRLRKAAIVEFLKLEIEDDRTVAYYIRARDGSSLHVVFVYAWPGWSIQESDGTIVGCYGRIPGVNIVQPHPLNKVPRQRPQRP